MELSNKFKSNTIQIICFLYALLFTYAAVSKLLDFENFQVQIGQSQLLSAFTFWVSWSVPAIEFLISFLLLSKKFKLLGLYSAFCLMSMFISYIFIVLHYSSFVPCSCGGILEKMDWNTHLAFNIIFILLALIAIFLFNLQKKSRGFSAAKFSIVLSVLFICSTSVIAVLFLISEDVSHKRNPFIRRFPSHPLVKVGQMNLIHPSFYFAGLDDQVLYLGNAQAPSHVLKLDHALKYKKSFSIKLIDSDLALRSVQVRVNPPYFYLADGTIPFVIRGAIADWKARTLIYNKAYFSKIEVINKDTFAIRAISSTSHENVLGIINGSDHKVYLNPKILERQIDGVFDTDGKLIYNTQFRKIIYVYYYRNEYIVNGSNLRSSQRNHTIDTTSKAQIKVANIESQNQKKIATPPLFVNRTVTSFSRYLFVNSARIGRYENEQMWNKASIIDVYDFTKNVYLFSFYIPHFKNKGMKDFRVIGNKVLVLYHQTILSYSLQAKLYEPNDTQ